MKFYGDLMAIYLFFLLLSFFYSSLEIYDGQTKIQFRLRFVFISNVVLFIILLLFVLILIFFEVYLFFNLI